MKIRLYSIRDDKVAQYQVPVRIDNDAVAVRQFGDLVTKDKETVIGQHSEDFALWYVGDFDADTGVFYVPSEGAYVVARGSDFVIKEN